MLLKCEKGRVAIGLAFISPWLLGFVLFYIYPFKINFIILLYYSGYIFYNGILKCSIKNLLLSITEILKYFRSMCGVSYDLVKEGCIR